MKYSILQHYKSKFNHPKIFVNAPGRANIIGEHTDYNHGLVLPFAIEQSIKMYIGENDSGLLRLFARDLNEYEEIDLKRLEFQKTGWIRYFVNSLVACKHKSGEEVCVSSGIDVAFGGNLPQGGGVSSSSALTCGFLAGINALKEWRYSNHELVSLASQAENGIGLNGGVMDQTAIFFGKKGFALKIDFLRLTIEEIEMPDDTYSFYLFNSGQKHNLVETEYNKRRSTCEQGLKTIRAGRSETDTFRDISRHDIDLFLHDEVAKKRCIHVLEENERVLEVIGILEKRNFKDLGQILLKSHKSLSENYEVSTQEIDYLVDRSQSISNMLGSRIMGGGFGGCTINFVKGKLKNEDIETLKRDYESFSGLELHVEKISSGNGIEVQHVVSEE